MAATKIHTKCNFIELNRNAAYKLKNGSPKFKDVFRSRCRARVKTNREKFINKLRNLCSCADVEVVLSILEPDKPNFPLDPDFDDEDILTEEEERIISEYEAMLAHEEDMFSDMLKKSSEVVCPICQKAALVTEPVTYPTSKVICNKCRFAIPTSKSLQDVGRLIESCVNTHSTACENEPEFHVVAEDDGMHIYMTCHVCSYMNIVI